MAVLLWSVVVVVVVAASTGVEGKTWVVGDGKGWSAIDFSAWLNGKVFAVGDELVFPYSQGTQDVAEVSQKDFETCNGKAPINHWIQGDTHVKLTTVGNKYYICTFPGHCPPLRLTISVVSSTNSTTLPTNQAGADVNTIASANEYSGNNNKNTLASNVAPLLHSLYLIGPLFFLSVWFFLS